MNEIALPALVGDQPAPFLAALGTLALVAYVLGDEEATLCWPESGGPAHLASAQIDSLDGLASCVAAIAERTGDSDELLPGSGPDFPPRKSGSGTDPTRSVPFESSLSWVVAEKTGSPTGSPPWLRSVFATNGATPPDHRSPGVLLRHPIFDAGPGTVSMSTTLENARDAAVDESAVRASLLAGRRVPGHIGGYLDWRADRDASQAGSRNDKTTSFGDPVLTWLGFLSIRLTTLIADGGRAVCGLTPKARNRALRKALVWPVWIAPLRAEEIEVLLCHAAIARLADASGDAVDERRRSGVERKLTALGVQAVFAAPRSSKGNNDGAYASPKRLWPER